MRREGRQLVVDVEQAGVVRGRVGPIGWVVVEVIAGQAPPGVGVVEVRCSSRSLAGWVGVSKDSVARALRALTDAGVVERVDHRDDRSGRFVSTSYLVDLAAAGISVASVSLPATPALPATESLRTDDRPSDDQLSLLG